MPTLKQTEIAIEDFCLREIVRPIATTLREMHDGIQRTIAKEFNADHDGAHAAFANRIADGCYDAVITVLEEAQIKARAEALVVKPPANAKPTLPVVFGPGKAASVNGKRVVAFKITPTYAYVVFKDDKTAYIHAADYYKAESMGLVSRETAPAGPSVTVTKLPKGTLAAAHAAAEDTKPAARTAKKATKKAAPAPKAKARRG